MVIVDVTWRTDNGGELRAYVRDPVRRGEFICGVWCSELGIGHRTEGCNEDAELRIFRSSIIDYQEAVL